MSTFARCDEIARLSANHSPFFAAPDELVEILTELAGTARVESV